MEGKWKTLLIVSLALMLLTSIVGVLSNGGIQGLLSRNHPQSQLEPKPEFSWTEPWINTAWLEIRLPLPQEINQTNYFQTVKSLTVSYDIEPSGIVNYTDEFGNNFVVMYWNEEQEKKLIASIEAIVLRKVDTIPVNTSDSYPIPEDLLPDDVKFYIKPWHIGRYAHYEMPSSEIESDHPEIVALAKVLSQGCTRLIDVVTNTFEWVGNNIEYDCPGRYENGSSSAVWTLKNRVGNCISYSNLMIALLRANGIPTRWVNEFECYEQDNPGYLKSIETETLHACVEVYFPQVGWVRYDPTFLSSIPYGIPLRIEPEDLGWIGPFRSYPNRTTTQKWQVIGWGFLENNEVKLAYIVTISAKEQSED